MAMRPLAFGMRLRDKDKGRTLRVHGDAGRPGVFVLEDERPGEPTQVRFHAELPEAIRDAAGVWRKRLH